MGKTCSTDWTNKNYKKILVGTPGTDHIRGYTVQSLINQNATVTSQQPAGTT
jgi:hypothetical protein